MQQIETANLVIDGIGIILMTICGIYLAVRAIKLRNVALPFFSLAMLSLLFSILVNALVQVDNRLVQSLFALNTPILIVLFTKLAFYKNKKSSFKIVFSITFSIKIVHFIEMIAFGYMVPSTVPIPGSQLGTYYFHALIVTSLIAIAFSWLAIAAYKSYKALRTEHVDAWVRNRLAAISISNAWIALSSLAYLLYPTDGLAQASPDALAANLINIPSVIAWAILNVLVWIMPDWLKRLLNAGQPILTSSENRNLFSDVPSEIKDRVITTPALVKVIDYLGDKLAVMIKKNTGAAKGLFLMAIDKELGEFGLYNTSLSNLLKVTNNSLKNLLKDMGIDSADTIVAKLADEIVKNQSVFLMMAV